MGWQTLDGLTFDYPYRIGKFHGAVRAQLWRN